jgi:hypothetical protein
METYYFLWVAVHKVLAEAPNVMLDLFIQSPHRACWKKRTDGLPHDILKKVQWR